MNYTEVFKADIINARRNIFKIIKQSDEEAYNKRERANKHKDEFQKIKHTYEQDTTDYGRALYLYKLEQNNMNIFPIERAAEVAKSYVARLEKFVECMNKKNDGKEIEYRAKCYELNSLVQTEATNYYKDEINFIRQQIITFRRWLEYCDIVKKNYPKEYEKKATSVELIKRQNDILLSLRESKSEEREQLLTVFKNEKFIMEQDGKLLNDLINKDIMKVVYTMYPKFQEKMVILEEKRNIKKSSRVEIQNRTSFEQNKIISFQDRKPVELDNNDAVEIDHEGKARKVS